MIIVDIKQAKTKPNFKGRANFPPPAWKGAKTWKSHYICISSWHQESFTAARIFLRTPTPKAHTVHRRLVDTHFVYLHFVVTDLLDPLTSSWSIHSLGRHSFGDMPISSTTWSNWAQICGLIRAPDGCNESWDVIQVHTLRGGWFKASWEPGPEPQPPGHWSALNLL